MEDAWPLWLMKRFPIPRGGRLEAERGGVPLGSWSTSNRVLPVRCACPSCNNGWMSQLENDTKPIVEALLAETETTLAKSAQLVLAAWAVKNAMVFEAFYPDRRRFYSDLERQQMRSERTIPQRTAVWITKCVNQPNAYSAAKDLWTGEATNAARAYATTMAFGSLAIQVLTIRVLATVSESATVTYDIIDGPWDEVLLQIWPVHQDSVEWPPRQGLAAEIGLDLLTERFNPSSHGSERSVEQLPQEDHLPEATDTDEGD